MKWEEVRQVYPAQFVKLKILNYNMIDNIRVIEDMATINAIKDNKEATRELMASKEDEIVYHTNNEEIIIT